MTDSLDNLIETLREELTQYGELLALLETQQQEILSRNADQVQEGAAHIHLQTQHLEQLKTRRETARKQLYADLSLEEGTSLKDSFTLLPPEYRPLLQALIDDNRLSINRIRKIARQNHLLLNRSLSTVQKLVDSLYDDGKPSIYGDDGRIPIEPKNQSIAYEHVC
jgi:flagellar biosynthesis/type III secretory pathway chaperone